MKQRISELIMARRMGHLRAPPGAVNGDEDQIYSENPDGTRMTMNLKSLSRTARQVLSFVD
jgi:hypothetical protein